MQVANVFLCRHPTLSAFAFRLGFGTAPVPAAAWALMLGAALAIVLLEEGRKGICAVARTELLPAPDPADPSVDWVIMKCARSVPVSSRKPEKRQ